MDKINFQTKLYPCPFCDFVSESETEAMQHIIYGHRSLTSWVMQEHLRKVLGDSGRSSNGHDNETGK